MNAVVEISGKQFKVSKDSKLYVHRLDAKEGSKVSFENVLLLDNGKKLIVGTPNVQGASVEAKVVKHLKDDKVIVFKKKRRKGYRVKNGHKQHLSEILIESISKNNNSSNKGKDKKAVSTKDNYKELKVDKERPDLKSKTLSELKDIAKSKKITGYSSMKKNDLIKSINSLN